MAQSFLKLGTKVAARELIPEAAKRVAKEVVPEVAERVVRQSGEEVVNNAFKLAPDLDGITHRNTKQGLARSIDLELPDSEKVVDHIQNRNFPEIEEQAAKGNRVVEVEAQANQLEEIANPVIKNTPNPQHIPTISSELNYIPEGTDLTAAVNTAFKVRKSAVKLKPGSENALSRLSSIGPIDSNQVKLWIQDAEKKALAGIPREVGGSLFDETGKYLGEEISGMTFQELHHEAMKKIYASYIDRAWKLVEAGAATPADIINLNYLAQRHGFGLGDWGVEPYNRLAHSMGHTASKNLGIEPTGTVRDQVVKAISGLENMNALTKDFERSLIEMSTPMRRQLDLHQRAFNALPTWDKTRFINLRHEKDDAKRILSNVYEQEFGNAPNIPSKNVEKWARKKTSKQSIIEAASGVDKARKAQDDFTAELTERITNQVGDDINIDERTIERIADERQGSYDTNSRNWRLMQQSAQEQQKRFPDPSRPYEEYGD